MSKKRLRAEAAAAQQRAAEAEAARMAIEQQMQAQQAAALAERQKQEQAALDRTGNIERFGNEAIARGQQTLRSQGLDDDLGQQLIDEIMRTRGNIGTTDDPKGVFAEDFASRLINQITTQKRNELSQQADQKFGPSFGRNAISSSFLDNTINKILDEQRGQAQQFVQRGTARGIYNDVGKRAADEAINNFASSGRSQLSNAATGVIDKYRTRADLIRDKVYGAVSGYRPGQQFSFEPYQQEANDVINSATNNAEGELRSTIGGTNFFDLSGLNQRAGQAQGAQNLRDADVATALAERKRRDSIGRGIGSQGSF